MTSSRAWRQSISRLLIGVLLLAQFAVASYACPSLNLAGATASSHAAMALPADMPPGCDQMVPSAANLCAEHCHAGQQSADTASAGMVGVGVAAHLYSLPMDALHGPGSSQSHPMPGGLLDAAPEPPHAILHCVFRI